MKALQQIIHRVIENPSRSWALATLVRTRGSTYRKPGARMLVDSEGRTLGVLSGGCLEEEIAQHGQTVIAQTTPVVLSFDTRRLYGCDGQLKILIEPLPAAEPNGNLITKVGRLLKDRDVCRIRTCFEGDTLGSELLSPDVLLAERRGTLIDTVPLPIRLLLFGTGPEIEPVTHLAGNLGWVIERFDHPLALAEDFHPDTQTAALVMNHNFGRDLLALDRVLPLHGRQERRPQQRPAPLREQHARDCAQDSEHHALDQQLPE